MFLLSVLVVFMLCYYCTTSFYLYFQALCQVLASGDKWIKSCDMLSRNRFCLLDGKIRVKSPEHLFDLNFLKVCPIQFWNFHLFWGFRFELHKFLQKINYYLMFCFSQILPCFTLLQFCKYCACFFLAKTFWQYWETVTLAGNFVSNKV